MGAEYTDQSPVLMIKYKGKIYAIAALDMEKARDEHLTDDEK